MEQLATWFVAAIEIYTVVGFVFAMYFALAGVQRLDPLARRTTVGFRLLILPGAAALWPLLLLRLFRS